MFGCRLRTSRHASWGRLAAASGMVGIACVNGDPAADVNAVLRHVRENAARLDIDETRIAVVVVLRQRAEMPWRC